MYGLLKIPTIIGFFTFLGIRFQLSTTLLEKNFFSPPAWLVWASVWVGHLCSWLTFLQRPPSRTSSHCSRWRPMQCTVCTSVRYLPAWCLVGWGWRLGRAAAPAHTLLAVCPSLLRFWTPQRKVMCDKKTKLNQSRNNNFKRFSKITDKIHRKKRANRKFYLVFVWSTVPVLVVFDSVHFRTCKRKILSSSFSQ